MQEAVDRLLEARTELMDRVSKIDVAIAALGAPIPTTIAAPRQNVRQAIVQLLDGNPGREYGPAQIESAINARGIGGALTHLTRTQRITRTGPGRYTSVTSADAELTAMIEGL